MSTEIKVHPLPALLDTMNADIEKELAEMEIRKQKQRVRPISFLHHPILTASTPISNDSQELAMASRERKRARKDADNSTEWQMRQQERQVPTHLLPNVSSLLSILSSAQPVLQQVSEDIVSSEITCVAPFAPGYSRDTANIKRYEPGKKGPEVEFLDLFKELGRNYAEGLARFRALDWIPDERMVFVCARELSEVRP
jgi:hypothetical protein